MRQCEFNQSGLRALASRETVCRSARRFRARYWSRGLASRSAESRRVKGLINTSAVAFANAMEREREREKERERERERERRPNPVAGRSRLLNGFIAAAGAGRGAGGEKKGSERTEASIFHRIRCTSSACHPVSRHSVILHSIAGDTRACKSTQKRRGESFPGRIKMILQSAANTRSEFRASVIASTARRSCPFLLLPPPPLPVRRACIVI